MPDIKAGDRVRVERTTTVEGVVRYVGINDEHPVATLTLTDGSGFSTHFGDVVTKLASPLKVGDKIEGAQAFLDLPVGAVMGDGKAKYNLLRTAKGFSRADGTRYPHDDGPEFTRTILYLPES